LGMGLVQNQRLLETWSRWFIWLRVFYWITFREEIPRLSPNSWFWSFLHWRLLVDSYFGSLECARRLNSLNCYFVLGVRKTFIIQKKTWIIVFSTIGLFVLLFLTSEVVNILKMEFQKLLTSITNGWMLLVCLILVYTYITTLTRIKNGLIVSCMSFWKWLLWMHGFFFVLNRSPK